MSAFCRFRSELTSALSRVLCDQSAFIIDRLSVTARSPLQEAGQSGFWRVAIQGVGGLLELNAVQEPVNGRRWFFPTNQAPTA
jgi:hypothetical protein